MIKISILNSITLEGEIWRQIPDYPNYMISNTGRVYSGYTNKIDHGTKNKKGYRIIELHENKRKQKYKFSHLVAMAFCDRFKKGMEVHHINCDNADDRAVNLLPVTKLEHIIIHALYRHIFKYPMLVVELFRRKKPNINVTINIDSDNMDGGAAA